MGGVSHTKESFIIVSKAIHNDKYDYSQMGEYQGVGVKHKFICPVHGEFWQLPQYHLKGCDCRKCGWEKTRIGMPEFYKRAKKFHGDKYGYDKVKFTTVSDMVTITCPIHGDFIQRVDGHVIAGYGCDACSKEANKIGKPELLKRFRAIHGQYYNYKLFKTYKDIDDKIKIICPKHGIFTQGILDHCRGTGCQKCNASHGERKVIRFLELNKIDFIREYKISGYNYRYDFYIPKLNILIEYDGQYHVAPQPVYDPRMSLEERIERDRVKTELASKRKYNLLRISYLKYKTMDMVIIDYISKLYPYYHESTFYKNVDSFTSALPTINADSYLTKNKLKKLQFQIALRYNLKNISPLN